MKIIILAVLLIAGIAPVLYAEECASDFNCTAGYQCIKAPFQAQGICMEAVNKYGVSTYPKPNPNSVYPNTEPQGDCRFDTDCPTTARCDKKYKVCVIR